MASKAILFGIRDRPKVVYLFSVVTESGTVTQLSVSAVAETQNVNSVTVAIVIRNRK